MSLNETKILVVGPAWVGDMVMAQSLFEFIKSRQPNTTIDVLAPDWSRSLLSRMPEVNKAIALPVSHKRLGLGQRRRVALSLKNEGYQQAIVLPNSFKSALIPYWAKIPKRTGWLGEYRWLLLNDVRYLNKEQLPLMVQRFVALGMNKNERGPVPAPAPKLVVSQKEVAEAIAKHHLEPDKKPILALCPGAEFGPSKRWPTEYFAEVANEQIGAGWQVWIMGSAKDVEMGQQIQHLSNNQCVNLIGKTSLAEAIDLFSLVKAVVTNDSGLMHIAAGLNKPLVAIYGSSSQKFTPPLSSQVSIVSLGLSCSPCFKRECPLGHMRCMNDLKSDKVLEALNKLMVI